MSLLKTNWKLKYGKFSSKDVIKVIKQLIFLQIAFFCEQMQTSNFLYTHTQRLNRGQLSQASEEWTSRSTISYLASLFLPTYLPFFLLTYLS